MIYFAQLETGAVKIGTTENVERRLSLHRGRYGEHVALLKTIPGGRIEERELDRRFAHLRLGRTEQFQPGADLLEFIGRPLLVTANPSAIEATPPTESAPRNRTVGLYPNDEANVRKIWEYLRRTRGGRPTEADAIRWAIDDAAKRIEARR